MKAYIGPYRYDLIPVRSWERNYEFMRYEQTGNYFFEEKDYLWYDKIVFGFFDKLNTLVRPINRWSNQRKRKIKIHVDGYDVWSADHTLALIIHPVLVELKKQKHGSPNVDDEDVPDYLKSTAVLPPEQDYDIDNNHHARWEYVLDEMIWAFEQCTNEDHNDDQFHHNSDQLEMKYESTGDDGLDGKGMKSIGFNYQKDPTKPPYWVDEEGKKAHYERISNGQRLFAKYYFGLWD